MVREPLVAGGFAATLGVVFAPVGQPALLAVAIVILAVITLAIRLRRGHIAPLPFLGAAFLAGLVVATLRLPDPTALRQRAAAQPGHPVEIEAVVAELPERTALGVALILDLEGGRARLTAPEPCGTVGDRIAGRARLAPHTPGLAPSFRAQSLAIQRGVAVHGAIEGCRVTAPGGRLGPLARRIHDGELRAMALGDRAIALSSGAMWLHGQSQLLATGGLTYFALSMALLAAAGRLRERWWLAIAPIALLTYGLGATPTHLRVLGIVACLAFARTGLITPRAGLALAAMLVTALDPPALGDVAFQLPFAAATALLGLAPALHHHGRLPRALAWSLALALGTAPLVARQFDRLSWTALLADGVTLPLGAVTGALALAWEPAAKTLLDALRVAIERLPPGALSTPSVLECTLAYAALAMAGAERPTRRTMGGLVFFAAALVLIAGAPRLERRLFPPVRASILPVASGHAVLVEDAEGRVLLEGLGGPGHPDPEAHARLISGVLRSRRLFAVDAVVVTSTGSATERLLARAHPFTLRVVADPRRIELAGHTLAITGTTATAGALSFVVEPPWAATSTISTATHGMITLVPEERGLVARGHRSGIEIASP